VFGADSKDGAVSAELLAHESVVGDLRMRVEQIAVGDQLRPAKSVVTHETAVSRCVAEPEHWSAAAGIDASGRGL